MFSIRKLAQSVAIITFCFAMLTFTHESYAQSAAAGAKNNSANVLGTATLGIARMVETKQKNLKDGSILSASQQGAVLSNFEYDPQVLGVISPDAAMLLSTSDSKNVVPVISNGSVYILVSTKDGAIKKGDLLTTSTI